MTSIWRSLPLLLAAGAGPLAAQEVYELGVQGVVTAADPAAVVGAIYGALRPSGRFRLAAILGAGASSGEVTGRGELLALFLLTPTAVARPGVYVGGGIAGVTGPVSQGYLVLLIGVEAAPAGRSGWAVEAGVGGGFRFAAGWRWRWRGRPRRD